MLLRRSAVVCLVALFSVAAASSRAQSSASPQWVGTWAASSMAAEGGFNVRPFCGVTLREIAHISVGGQRIRVRLSNAFGTDPLTVVDAHVALSAGGSKIQEGSDHPLTFDGATSVRIPAGAEMYSDPVDLTVAPMSDVAVSFYLPAQVMRSETYHSFADQHNYLANGNVTGAAELSEPSTFTSWYFFDGIDVAGVDGSRALVTLGDSITDGAKSTLGANHRWPDILAERLQQEKGGLEHVAVLNEGIGGNRVLNDVAGPSALARLDRDVLAQDGAKYVVVLESINDIGRLLGPTVPDDQVDAQQLERGLAQIAQAAHEHGMKAFGATLTPYKGAKYFSDKGEEVREAVNNWIRTSGTFDGVFDFEKATQDPQNPLTFNPQYDSGDHLHPNDAGYRAMARSVDLSLLK